MAAPAAAPAAVPPASKPPAPPAVTPAAKPPAGPPGTPNAMLPITFAANKPDEPVFQLKLEPENRILFKGDRMFEGTTTIDIKLTNTSKARQTFKVHLLDHLGCFRSTSYLQTL
uniref:Major sperm protein n=1 Tax=Parascaris univalens TaxID=6257 RepID=A0A915BXM3_PARUN